jgi:hypothetical protein
MIKFKELLIGSKKNALIGVLMLTSLFIVLPNFVFIAGSQFAPYMENEVVITTIYYTSEGISDDGREINVIVGDLFQPSPKFANKTYPAIIACHDFQTSMGRESMSPWCVELTKRGFVVLSIDLPSQGMSTGEMDIFPREDYVTPIVEDGINYLKSLDFVNGSAIGLIGMGFGGTAVSMSTGNLSNLVNATVSLNGLTNLTNWLIGGRFTNAGIDYTVGLNNITMNSINGIAITNYNMLDFLKLYGIIRGSNEYLEGLIIDGTNCLNRTVLNRFDAAENLPHVKNNSVMFIHSSRDTIFGLTNQSGQGYDSIVGVNKSASYISVNDNHNMLDDPNYIAYYCAINFFEEKLLNVNLSDSWSSDLEKYSQHRDIILTYSLIFKPSLLYGYISVFLISLIPLFLIISLIFYNKKITKNRAIKSEEILKKKESEEDFIDFSFGRGSFVKTITFLAILYLIAYVGIIGMALGLFSDLIVGTLGGMFYFVFFMTLYYLPDQAEVDIWKRMKVESQSTRKEKTINIKDYIILSVIIAFTIFSALIGLVSTFFPSILYQPIEPLLRSMLIIGCILLIGGVFIVFILEKKENPSVKLNDIDWNSYALDKYQVIKSVSFGSVLFLSIFFQWNIQAYFLKFPMRIAPHSVYYLFLVFSVLLFFSGIQLLVKIFKERILRNKVNFLLHENSRKEMFFNIIVELGSSLFTLLIAFLLIFITYALLLNTTLFGNLAVLLALLFVVICLLTDLIKILCVDRGNFGISIFLPLLIFTIFGFFLRI